MFSKRTEPAAIASQLVFLFTLAAAFLLSCGLGVFYWLVVRHAFEEDNAVLADKISAVSADLRSGGPKALDQELKNARTGEHAVYWVRVVDSAGRIVTETPGMNGLLAPSIFPGTPTSTSATRNPKNYRIGGRLFSLVTSIEKENGQPYTLQVAQDRSTDDQFTKEFGALLAVVLAFGILAATAIAITVTKRGLRPLAEMTHSLERVGPAHLSERVPPARWPRELRPLAVAFDEMLDRLEDSFTRLSQFSADLAHELRTPIANILGEAQVALTRGRTPEEYREVIESTICECERLSGIVDNLLFLARAESADKQITATVFDGRAAIEKIAAYYQTVADDRHITITCSGQGDVHADPSLFRRAVSNLVDNALRFTPDNGKIQISVATRNNRGEISVNDTGCGIAAEHLPRVFDRFYRIDPSRSSYGAGLGLALVKSIVDLHGGSARMQSEVDRGTTVTLIFPGKIGPQAKA
jgi:two-component system, OmpR family, heavy metal sensor histidine kinase CusS